MKTLLATVALALALAAGAPAQTPALPSVEPTHVYRPAPHERVGSLAMSPNKAGSVVWDGKVYTLMLDSLGVEVWVDSAYAGLLSYPQDFVEPEVAAQKQPDHPPIAAFEKLTVVFATLIPGPRVLIGIVFRK